ncbi:MAG TPA: hypothetical protein VNV66_03150 [Pilimelia sp.]|nr:hypothetical protein [Pilimelia sp.]
MDQLVVAVADRVAGLDADRLAAVAVRLAEVVVFVRVPVRPVVPEPLPDADRVAPALVPAREPAAVREPAPARPVPVARVPPTAFFTAAAVLVAAPAARPVVPPPFAPAADVRVAPAPVAFARAAAAVPPETCVLTLALGRPVAPFRAAAPPPVGVAAFVVVCLAPVAVAAAVLLPAVAFAGARVAAGRLLACFATAMIASLLYLYLGIIRPRAACKLSLK